MRLKNWFFPSFFVLFSLFCVSGCDLWDRMMGKRGAEKVEKKEAVSVEVLKPIEREVVDYEEFTGETEAVDQVIIQAQVSGIITKCDFVEGAFVRKDDVLFEIEPEVYQAALDTAIGNLESMKGELTVLKAREPQLRIDKERNAKLVQSNAVSKADYDEAAAAHDECLAKILKGEADILKAEAEVQKAQIDLRYTRVLSPINGFISRKLITEGNLIQDHITELARIVSHDPIYVLFYVDETTYLKLAARAKQNAEKGVSSDNFQIEYRMTNENSFTDTEGHPLHTGTVLYTDPKMDDASGTVLLRATCPNPVVENAKMSAIIPGMVVHVRIPVTDHYQALLVPEEAFGTEQGIRYLYVKDSEGKAKVIHPVLGPLQSDNMRVIRSGLEPDDEVIVSGLLRLRPGTLLDVKETTLEELRQGIE